MNSIDTRDSPIKLLRPAGSGRFCEDGASVQPLIGISCPFDQTEKRYFIPEAYVEAVIAAGGMPVMLPGAGSLAKAAPYFRGIKGLVLAGGADIDPKHYNEEPQPMLGEITPDRDRFEMMLVETAVRKNIPVFGICRGMQVLNIACGGTVIQHIPSSIQRPLKHFQAAPRWYPTHKVQVEKSSLLGSIIKTGVIRVNSFHHQAVREVAPGFVVSAFSKDGVIEAIENPRHKFMLGVQWHPECMVEKSEKTRALFDAFMSAVKG